jgi:hypothetical protein
MRSRFACASTSTIGSPNRCGRKDIRFRQSTNAFSLCSNPKALQQLADSLTADDLQRLGEKRLSQLIHFFTPRERRYADIDHRLFFAQVEARPVLLKTPNSELKTPLMAIVTRTKFPS